MTLLKKFAGETVIYGLGSILPRLLFFMLTPYLTRAFDPNEYGIYNVMYSFTALLLVFFTYGMETALFRFGSKEGQLNKVFSTAAISLLVTTIIFVGALFLFSEEIAIFLKEPEGSRFVKWFALVTGLDALSSLPFAKLRLENKPIRFAAVRILNVTLLLGFTFFFLLVCPWLMEQGYDWFENIYSEETILDLVFLANLIASSVVFLVLFRNFFSFKWAFDFPLWRKMMNYALPLVLVGVAGVINLQMDRIFLVRLLPNNQAALVGIYSASVKIAVLMNLFITAFKYAAEPFFFKNAEKNDSKVIYAQIAQAFSVVGSIVFLGIMLYLDLVQLLVGKDFRSGLEVIPFLLLAYFGLGLFFNFSIWYKLTDRTRIGAWISIGGAIITISVNYFFIPKIGIMAPAYAALACYASMATVSYFIGKKYYPIDYPIGKMLGYITLAVAVYVASTFLRPYLEENLISILLVNTVLMVGYLGIIYRDVRQMLV